MRSCSDELLRMMKSSRHWQRSNSGDGQSMPLTFILDIRDMPGKQTQCERVKEALLHCPNLIRMQLPGM